MPVKNIPGLTRYLTNIVEKNIAKKCCIEMVKKRIHHMHSHTLVGLGLGSIGRGHGVDGAVGLWTVMQKSRPKTFNMPIFKQATNAFANSLHQSNGANPCRFTLPLVLLISRRFCDKTNMSMSEDDIKKAIENITDKFMAAQELLEDAEESKDTVYFNEDLNDASEAVSETLRAYSTLLDVLTEQQKQNVVRSIGLKMEELKAHQSLIIDSLKED